MFKTVSFFGTCPASSRLTLVSDRIGHPYMVKHVRVSFADGPGNLMPLEFIISEDDEAPTAGRPSGISILDEYGQVAYIKGDGEVVEMVHEVDVPVANTWLKVYGNNADIDEHAINVQICIKIE